MMVIFIANTIEIDLTRIGGTKRNFFHFTTLDSLTARWNERPKGIKFRTVGEKVGNISSLPVAFELVRHVAEKRN